MTPNEAIAVVQEWFSTPGGDTVFDELVEFIRQQQERIAELERVIEDERQMRFSDEENFDKDTKEMARLTERIAELEQKVEELTYELKEEYPDER